jgi:CBS domain-containing protein
VLVRDIMSSAPARIGADADLRRAAETVAASGASDLMVVDGEDAFIGVLSEGDILRAAMPDRDEVLDAGGTLADAFEIFIGRGGRLSARPIAALVIRDPIVLSPDDHVGAAAAILVDQMIRCLPVVDDGTLVGTVSRADVCRAVVGAA